MLSAHHPSTQPPHTCGTPRRSSQPEFISIFIHDATEVERRTATFVRVLLLQLCGSEHSCAQTVIAETKLTSGSCYSPNLFVPHSTGGCQWQLAMDPG